MSLSANYGAWSGLNAINPETINKLTGKKDYTGCRLASTGLLFVICVVLSDSLSVKRISKMRGSLQQPPLTLPAGTPLTTASKAEAAVAPL